MQPHSARQARPAVALLGKEGAVSGIPWRASADEPCPVCGGDHACSALEDGLHFCLRRHEAVPGWRHLGDDPNQGFGLFRREGDGRRPEPPAVRPRREPPDWSGLQRSLTDRKDVGERRRELAERLGPAVLSEVAARLGVGWREATATRKGRPIPGVFTLPERDAEGRITGLATRDRDGNKRSLEGSRRGLLYPDGWQQAPAVYVPEGASDVLALVSCGLAAIGRSTKYAGGDARHLARMLRGYEGDVVILAERDSGGGLEGALRHRAELKRILRRSVLVAFPPALKDARAWLNAAVPEWGHKAAGERFAHGLEIVPDDDNERQPEGCPKVSNKNRDEDKTLSDKADKPGSKSESPVLDLPFPPPSESCPFARARSKPVLRHRRQRADCMVLAASCRCWSCPVCFHRMRYLRARHYAECMAVCGRPLFVGALAPAEWPTAHKQLRRAGASYVKVDAPPAFALFATAAAEGLGPAATADALRAFAEAVRGLEVRAGGARGGGPFSSSRDWAPLRKKRKAQWRRVTRTRASEPLPVQEALAAEGVIADVIAGGGGAAAEWLVPFRIPPEWPPERERYLFDRLADLPADENPFTQGGAP